MVHVDSGKSNNRYWNYFTLRAIYCGAMVTCAGGLSAVNVIGAQLRDPIYSGLTRSPSRKAGRILGGSTRFGLSVENKRGRADAGRDGRTPFHETRFSGANGDRGGKTEEKKNVFLSSLPRAGLANHNRFIYVRVYSAESAYHAIPYHIIPYHTIHRFIISLMRSPRPSLRGRREAGHCTVHRVFFSISSMPC